MIFLLVTALAAQQNVTQPQSTAQPSEDAAILRFEAASVKPISGSAVVGGRSGPEGGVFFYTPGRVQSDGAGVTVRRIILDAYHVNTASQVSGGPNWLDSDLFDISAVANKAADTNQLKLMLRGLLKDRFKLVLSRSTREMQVYALVVAKNGPKLHEAKPGDPTPTTGKEITSLGILPAPRPGERIAGSLFSRENLRDFALELSQMPSFDRPVVDETGLKGEYLLGLRWYAGEDITTAIQDMLGLKLESQRVPVDIFTVEHIERPDSN
jgi:uncharacterized protein (TIGR03435 family)